jgi:hypothetical protein
MNACPNCGFAPTPPPEPSLGTWMRDQHGEVLAPHRCRRERRLGDAGLLLRRVWDAHWAAHGPLIECGPWGAPRARLPFPPE